MLFDSNRMMYLSGLKNMSEYRDEALDNDSSLLTESAEPCSTPEPLTESKLRQVIRKEIQSMLSEMQAQADVAQIQSAQQSKSLSTVFGTGGHPQYGGKPRKNRALARGAGGSIGFGGPGFM